MARIDDAAHVTLGGCPRAAYGPQATVRHVVESVGRNYEQLIADANARLSFTWGLVPFDLKLERVVADKLDHQTELILTVTCYEGIPDPNWRYPFTVRVGYHLNLIGVRDHQGLAEQSIEATRSHNALVIPIMRLPGGITSAGVTLRLTIEISSRTGGCPPLTGDAAAVETPEDAAAARRAADRNRRVYGFGRGESDEEDWERVRRAHLDSDDSDTEAYGRRPISLRVVPPAAGAAEPAAWRAPVPVDGAAARAPPRRHGALLRDLDAEEDLRRRLRDEEDLFGFDTRDRRHSDAYDRRPAIGYDRRHADTRDRWAQELERELMDHLGADARPDHSNGRRPADASPEGRGFGSGALGRRLADDRWTESFGRRFTDAYDRYRDADAYGRRRDTDAYDRYRDTDAYFRNEGISRRPFGSDSIDRRHEIDDVERRQGNRRRVEDTVGRDDRRADTLDYFGRRSAYPGVPSDYRAYLDYRAARDAADAGFGAPAAPANAAYPGHSEVDAAAARSRGARTAQASNATATNAAPAATGFASAAPAAPSATGITAAAAPAATGVVAATPAATGVAAAAPAATGMAAAAVRGFPGAPSAEQFAATLARAATQLMNRSLTDEESIGLLRAMRYIEAEVNRSAICVGMRYSLHPLLVSIADAPAIGFQGAVADFVEQVEIMRERRSMVRAQAEARRQIRENLDRVQL